jgi:hypothetical protein
MPEMTVEKTINDVKKPVPDIWFTTMAPELQVLRQKAREIRRITFDCLSAIVKGDHVVCKLGHPIGRGPEGSMLLLTVLRGRSSLQCKNCPDYEEDDTED